MIYNKIVARRTIRKYEDRKVPDQVLVKCVDAARLSPSGSNLQPLKFVIVKERKLLDKVFSTLSWISQIPDYTHAKQERPKAYIIVLLDTSIRMKRKWDVGIAVMSISMVAFDEGLGTCILGSINREKLREALNIPQTLKIELVISLGYPAEKSVVEKMKNGDVKVWIDESGVIHVPKRELKEVLRWNGY